MYDVLILGLINLTKCCFVSNTASFCRFIRFRPHTETEEPSRVVNKYKMAASYGKFNTSNDPEGCKTKYEECIVNLLDIVQNLMGLFLK